MKTLSAVIFALLVSLPAMADERLLQNIVDDGWATTQGYRFSGRLTELRQPAAAGSGSWTTVYRNARMLLTSGEEGRVGWSVGDLRWQTRADDHGYWELQASQPLDLLPGWHLVTSDHPSNENAGLLVHDVRNRFGLISDIDDTILVSEVNRKARLLTNSLTVPPEDRIAVPGMAALYRGLLAQNAHPEVSPVFYVSASPRQLTDSVRRFLAYNDFPRGVLQLKEVDRESGESLTDQQAYKVQRITMILQAFPEVRFTLVGDDGEADPESFASLQALFPDQIAEVWIRRVHPDPDRIRHAGQEDLALILD